MPGALHRRIIIASKFSAPGCGSARAVVEDDFHNFRVTVDFKDEVITHATGTGIRYPYTACPAAGDELQLLATMKLSRVSTEVYKFTEARTHCTHMLDLAGIAISAAARGIKQRTYDIQIPDRHDSRTNPAIYRDGVQVVAWEVDQTTIHAPATYEGISYRHGFASWARKTLSVDEAEAALALRRALIISVGRTKKLDEQMHAVPTGYCFAQQPDRAETALRIKGSTQDFTNRADQLCAGDAEWIAFKT